VNAIIEIAIKKIYLTDVAAVIEEVQLQCFKAKTKETSSAPDPATVFDRVNRFPSHPQIISDRLSPFAICLLTPKRAAGRKPWGKLSPAASHDLLCQLWQAALWDRIRATPLVGMQPTDRQLHYLLQRHATL
jgi:hypothetical protein